MVKDIVEPIFASTLPGPLSTLRFSKVDLGHIPIRVSEVDVHKVDNGGIKLDMDVIWEGRSDIELEGKLIPKLVRPCWKDLMLEPCIAKLDDRESGMFT